MVNFLSCILFVTLIAGVLVPEVDSVLTVVAIIGGLIAILFGTGLVEFIRTEVALRTELARYTIPADMEAWRRSQDANRNAIPSPPEDRPLRKAVGPAAPPGDEQ